MSTNPQQVQAIFLATVEKPLPERAAFLERECGDDVELRQRVEALLRAHDEPGGILEFPPTDEDATTDQPIKEKPGTRIGPYKLLQQIGEGGMGVVYMAEQTEPVKRRVALKIIKPGMDTRHVIARFEAERQALAMMDHTNIAKVLDAGQTGAGRPYFVMELVNGTPITDYCDEQRLTPTERLELFVPVCQAVQHAHQKGIIHRDLKPTNILVALYDGQAVPKVIDFGVAKATGQSLTEKTLFTEFGQVIGTLEYMSPEQAERNQLDIDTRSDIYSLGVILYELLVGETPFDRGRLRSAAFHEILRILREEDPPRPSTRLSGSQSLPSIAANRRLEPVRLAGTIRGDLDWIVMKALEKDRVRRYDTASALSEDIIRFLGDEAVAARPPSRIYRFRKFARRNRALMTTAIAVLLTLIIGLVGISWQLLRVKRAELIAQRERQVAEMERKQADEARELAATNLVKARAAVGELLKVASQLAEISEAEHIRREIVDSALSYYDDFLRSNHGNPEMQADVASTHLYVGRLKAQLGDFRDALSSYDKAETMLRTARQDAAQGARFQRILASVRFEQGWAQLQLRDVETAVTSFNNAVQMRNKIVDEFAQDSDRLDLARDYHNLAIALDRSGDSEQAAEAGEKSLEITKELLKIQPSSYVYRTRVARILGFLGALKAGMGLWTEASPYMHVAAEIHEQLAKDNPTDRDCTRRVAVAADWLAQLALQNQDYESALGQSKRAIQISEDLVESYPTRFRYRAELADHYLTLASICNAMGQQPQTCDAFRNAIDSYRMLATKNASYAGLMRALSQYGNYCLEHSEFEEAVTVLRDQLKLTVEADMPEEARGIVRFMLGAALARRGLGLLETDAGLARRDLEQGVAYLENAYSELKKNENALSDSSKKQIIEIVELLVEIYTDWKRPDDAGKWQKELENAKTQRGDLPKN